jgi:hypothetical protein
MKNGEHEKVPAILMFIIKAAVVFFRRIRFAFGGF